MQRTNLIIFVLLAAAILGGWFWMATSIFPPKELVQDDSKQKEEKAKAIKEKADQAKANREKADKEKAEKDKAEKKNPANEEKKPIVKGEPARTETIGGEGFHLTVDTITRGGGVRRVVLNNFKAADWQGRPTRPERDLELIQDDEFSPAFRMYHYVLPKDDNPVFGLGEKIWTLEGRSPPNADTHEVRYSTTVPGMDQIKIVKTYRLAPKDYHVTLLLEFHDLRTDKNAAPIPFRYQLTGGQGIPIEGEWYTATFRNALMGLVDPSGSLYRKLEDSSRISPRRGGDSWPGDKYSRGANRLQYAGIANQYFGVMIVVDKEQPSREEGGTTADKVLAWARPTLETTEKRGIIVKKDFGDGRMLFSDDKGEALPYVLLPRVKKHLEDLELKDGNKAVLSFYDRETPDGKQRVATWVRLGETLKPQFDDITMRVNSEVLELIPGVRDVHKHQFVLYHGPVKVALLAQFSGEKEVSGALVKRYADDLHLRTLTDYHSDNYFGQASSFIGLTWLIIKFTQLMHELLYWLQFVFGYGFGIVVLTVMVRGAMFPISRKQAMFSIKMQELAPELKKIQQKYPEDAQARMQATQEFYRKHGINPLGSCWPVFLQMPIFLGLYFALQESVHFRLADFLWIESLSAPDMLFGWGESIPVISSPDHAGGVLGMLYLGPYLNILPMIAVVFMMIQQLQTMPPPTDDQQAMQQKMLKFMTIFFGIMFYKVAAGLCIYFISSSLWGLAERKLLPKKKPIAEFAGVGQSGVSLSNTGAPLPKGSLAPKDQGKWAKKDKEKIKVDEAITTIDKLKAMWREILKQAEKK